ncbi:hypothetical protein DFJ58DRAFT_740861 [Suillus subalutaceus]|uniref:uncharacterized protein n=1 Tax=Suillus subalutaceus TaxID=48586 RepID=UPI001B880B10|nr:uncharacterized protein DFJ58DRAFT_740861 [Suillus subalutaceus]KAG1876639.1 hypothetical protein DFJ58DRAFT_740861 [Suillus subalutaceus]
MMVFTSIDIIPRGGTTLVEQCRTDIDKDIAALFASLSALRSRRNALASIFSLPPEVLVNIFIYFVEEGNFKIYTGIPRRGGAPILMIVTHVCRHWRQVALECPSLWTFIDIDCLSAPWVPIMLERSKKAALVVIYNEPSSPEYWPLVQLLSQLPRIKVLKLCTFSIVVDLILDCLSSEPAPLLQIFNYKVLGNHDPRISVRPISDSIFQGRAPLLRSVELAECAFILTSHVFSGLQTLDLRQIGPSPHLTLSQLHSALKRMPDLELLTLFLSSRISEDTELFDQVPLTRLRRIVLNGCAIRTAVSLFSHLVLPVDASIALCLTEIESPQSFSDLFSAIHKDPDRSFPIIRSLHAKFTDDTVSVQFSTSLAYIRNRDIVRLSIQFEYASDSAIIFGMCRMVPHHKIQKLYISTSLDLSQDFWRAGFAHLPELESVNLRRTSIAGFILALMPVGVSMACPLLRALDIYDTDIGCDELRDLREIARMRAKGDVCIQKLGLMDCRNVTEGNVQLLERVIAYVEWDGHEDVLMNSHGGCICPTCLDSDDSEDSSADAHSED